MIFSAQWTISSCKKRLFVDKMAIWLVAASTTFGWQWPTTRRISKKKNNDTIINSKKNNSISNDHELTKRKRKKVIVRLALAVLFLNQTSNILNVSCAPSLLFYYYQNLKRDPWRTENQMVVSALEAIKQMRTLCLFTLINANRPTIRREGWTRLRAYEVRSTCMRLK